MNKIFKVVWSKARNAYVVVSETAKNTTKGCSSKKLIAMLVATGVLASGGVADAAKYVDQVSGYNGVTSHTNGTQFEVGTVNAWSEAANAQLLEVGNTKAKEVTVGSYSGAHYDWEHPENLNVTNIYAEGTITVGSVDMKTNSVLNIGNTAVDPNSTVRTGTVGVSDTLSNEWGVVKVIGDTVNLPENGFSSKGGQLTFGDANTEKIVGYKIVDGTATFFDGEVGCWSNVTLNATNDITIGKLINGIDKDPKDPGHYYGGYVHVGNENTKVVNVLNGVTHLAQNENADDVVVLTEIKGEQITVGNIYNGKGNITVGSESTTKLAFSGSKIEATGGSTTTIVGPEIASQTIENTGATVVLGGDTTTSVTYVDISTVNDSDGNPGVTIINATNPDTSSSNVIKITNKLTNYNSEVTLNSTSTVFVPNIEQNGGTTTITGKYINTSASGATLGNYNGTVVVGDSGTNVILYGEINNSGTGNITMTAGNNETSVLQVRQVNNSGEGEITAVAKEISGTVSNWGKEVNLGGDYTEKVVLTKVEQTGNTNIVGKEIHITSEANNWGNILNIGDNNTETVTIQSLKTAPPSAEADIATNVKGNGISVSEIYNWGSNVVIGDENTETLQITSKIGGSANEVSDGAVTVLNGETVTIREIDYNANTDLTINAKDKVEIQASGLSATKGDGVVWDAEGKKGSANINVTDGDVVIYGEVNANKGGEININASGDVNAGGVNSNGNSMIKIVNDGTLDVGVNNIGAYDTSKVEIESGDVNAGSIAAAHDGDVAIVTTDDGIVLNKTIGATHNSNIDIDAKGDIVLGNPNPNADISNIKSTNFSNVNIVTEGDLIVYGSTGVNADTLSNIYIEAQNVNLAGVSYIQRYPDGQTVQRNYKGGNIGVSSASAKGEDGKTYSQGSHINIVAKEKITANDLTSQFSANRYNGKYVRENDNEYRSSIDLTAPEIQVNSITASGGFVRLTGEGENSKIIVDNKVLVENVGGYAKLVATDISINAEGINTSGKDARPNAITVGDTYGADLIIGEAGKTKDVTIYGNIGCHGDKNGNKVDNPNVNTVLLTIDADDSIRILSGKAQPKNTNNVAAVEEGSITIGHSIIGSQTGSATKKVLIEAGLNAATGFVDVKGEEIKIDHDKTNRYVPYAVYARNGASTISIGDISTSKVEVIGEVRASDPNGASVDIQGQNIIIDNQYTNPVGENGYALSSSGTAHVSVGKNVYQGEESSAEHVAIKGTIITDSLIDVCGKQISIDGNYREHKTGENNSNITVTTELLVPVRDSKGDNHGATDKEQRVIDSNTPNAIVNIGDSTTKILDINGIIAAHSGAVNIFAASDGQIKIAADNDKEIASDSAAIRAENNKVYVGGADNTNAGSIEVTGGLMSYGAGASGGKVGIELLAKDIKVETTGQMFSAQAQGADIRIGNDDTDKVNLKGHVFSNGSKIDVKGKDLTVHANDSSVALNARYGSITIGTADKTAKVTVVGSVGAYDGNVEINGADIAITTSNVEDKLIEKLRDGSEKEYAVNKYAVQSHGGEVNIADGGTTENVAITGGVYAEMGGSVNIGGAFATVVANEGDLAIDATTGAIVIVGNENTASQVTGDVFADKAGNVFANFKGSKAFMFGKVTTDNTTTGATEMNFNDGALWRMTGNSNVSALTLNNSMIDMTKNAKGNANKLVVDQAMSGTGGVFKMDLTYHDNEAATYQAEAEKFNGDTDYIYVNGAAPSKAARLLAEPAADGSDVENVHTIAFDYKTAKNLSEMEIGDKLYFAEVNNAAKMGFGEGEVIRAANMDSFLDYLYQVKSEDSTIKDDYKEWYITPYDAKPEPEEDVPSEQIPEDTTPKPPVNNNGTTPIQAYNAAQAMWRDDDTLLKRLGELRYTNDEGGVWARMIGRKLQDERDYGFNVHSKTAQVGYDRKDVLEDGSGTLRKGFAVAHTWGSTSFKEGHGHANATDLSLYATNLRSKGHYWDLVARVGKVDSEYDSAYGDHGDFDNWATSVSAEYGRKKKLNTANWYIEPQAQLTYSYMWGDDYTTRKGIKIHQDNANSLVGRAGFILSKEWENELKHPARAYAKAFVMHEFLDGGQTHMSLGKDHYSNGGDFKDTWYVVGVGANVDLGKQCTFYFDAEKNFKASVKMPYRVEAGFRWEF